ncbi:MAG: hypothetical protein ACXWCH_35115 [Burkholderiales bacterium]
MRSIVRACVFVFAAVACIASYPPASAIAAEPLSQLVKVPLDVDVYDQPGGEGKPRNGFLPGGSMVGLVEERDDHWCHVQGDAVPGKSGWVWCGIGDDGKNYELTKSDSNSDTGTPPDSGTGSGTPPPD